MRGGGHWILMIFYSWFGGSCEWVIMNSRLINEVSHSHSSVKRLFLELLWSSVWCSKNLSELKTENSVFSGITEGSSGALTRKSQKIRKTHTIGCQKYFISNVHLESKWCGIKKSLKQNWNFYGKKCSRSKFIPATTPFTHYSPNLK